MRLLALLVLVAASVASAIAQDRAVFGAARDAYGRDELEEAIPLFRQAVATAETTGDAEGARSARVWLAEALRRRAQQDHAGAGTPDGIHEAIALAGSVLAEAPCHARAHLVLASVYNRQYGWWEGASDDAAWHHVGRAVACDPGDGNGWVDRWTQALRRGDADAAQQALQKLHQVEFWPTGLMALARWMLEHAPPRALFLTNGDADTIPMAVAAYVEGTRPDVAVVNVSMLDLPEVVRHYASVYGLPLPGLVEVYERELAQGGVSFRLGHAVLQFWLKVQAEGSLDRPVVGAFTLSEEVVEQMGPVADRGAHLAPAETTAMDVRAARAATIGLDGAAFAGSSVSAEDWSPIRRAYAFSPAENVVLSILRIAVALANEGDLDGARAEFQRAAAFAETAGIPDAPSLAVFQEWLDTAHATD